jgi:CheY-like chemotaxis protein
MNNRNDADEGNRSMPPDVQRFPYALVADSNQERTVACVAEAATTFSMGVLVAQDGEEAISTFFRYGPPKLLSVDLSLPRKDGFAVIEALRQIDRGQTAIIAWAETRELREFAVHRLAGLHVKVLGASVAPAILRNAMQWARGSGRTAVLPDEPAGDPQDVRSLMNSLATHARRISGAAGVAVYFRPADETHYRAAVTWNSDLPMPASPELLPGAFEMVLHTGDVCVLPDLYDEPSGVGFAGGRTDRLRGLLAVPIVADRGKFVGVIVVFDVQPLALGKDALDALKALGQTGAAGALMAAPPAEDAAIARRPTEFLVSRVDVAPADGVVAAEVPNRSTAAFAVAREVARARREQLPLSIALFEVMANEPDAAGRPGRDTDPVAGLRDTLFRVTRASDLTIRWNPGQVLVVLSGLGEAAARQVAERIRTALQVGGSHRRTVAGGVVELAPGETFDRVTDRALEKLQAAKARGHNRIA